LPKKLLLLAFVILISFTCHAEEVNYFGAVSVKLDSTVLEAGQTLEAEITAINNEGFPLADSHLVVHLVQGNDFYYPPQAYNKDNVFFEETIPNINLPAKGSKEITFSYNLPENLSPGTYRLDVYFRNKKTFIAGIPHLFAAPVSTKFQVSGQGQFPEAKILRKDTVFEDIPGQLSFPAEPGAQFEGHIFIKNTSSDTLSNLKLSVGLCNWDDTRCEQFEPSTTEEIEPVVKGEKKEVVVSMTAPTMPSAYVIRMELRDSSGNLLSMFRNRVIVTGETRIIRKIYTDNYYYKAGQDVKLHSYTSPSPDHFTYPVLEGSQLNISVKDLQSNSMVFQDSIALQEDWQSNDFQFKAAKDLSNFEVCGEVTKASQVFDKYCYTVDAADFALDTLTEISVDWGYHPKEQMLSLELCSASKEGFPANLDASYFLRAKDTLNILGSGNVSGRGCVQEPLQNVYQGTHLLSVLNNFNGEEISLELEAISEDQCYALCNDKNPCTLDTCTSEGCGYENVEDGTSCGSQTICQSGKCVESADFSLLFIAVAVIIVAGLIYLIYWRQR